MELYVTVSFWVGVIGVVINLLSLVGSNYPKVRTETIGGKVFLIIVGLIFAAWSGMLLFN